MVKTARFSKGCLRLLNLVDYLSGPSVIPSKMREISNSNEGLVMKLHIALVAFFALILSACAATYQYQTPADSQKFFADKLSCENQYTLGFNVWGNKVYGNIYQEGPARDCMLAKGYQSIN